MGSLQSCSLVLPEIFTSSPPDPSGVIPIEAFFGTHIKNMATIFVLYERWMTDTEVLRWSRSWFDKNALGRSRHYFWFQAVDEKDKVIAVPRIAIHM